MRFWITKYICLFKINIWCWELIDVIMCEFNTLNFMRKIFVKFTSQNRALPYCFCKTQTHSIDFFIFKIIYWRLIRIHYIKCAQSLRGVHWTHGRGVENQKRQACFWEAKKVRQTYFSTIKKARHKVKNIWLFDLVFTHLSQQF